MTSCWRRSAFCQTIGLLKPEMDTPFLRNAGSSLVPQAERVFMSRHEGPSKRGSGQLVITGLIVINPTGSVKHTILGRQIERVRPNLILPHYSVIRLIHQSANRGSRHGVTLRNGVCHQPGGRHTTRLVTRPERQIRPSCRFRP
jgi:hypothetical protein